MAFGYAVYAADRYVLASVLGPLQSSLALTSSEVALLGAAQYIGVTCFVFIAGHLSDRYGRWWIILVGVAVFSAFTWLIGLSSDFLEAFIFRLVSGFGEGIFWPVAMASVAGYFRNRKGLALGIFYDGFDIGGVAGLSIGGITYYLTDSWRPAFFVAPTLGIVAMVGVMLTKNKFANGNKTTVGNSSNIRLGRDALQLLKRRNVSLLMIFALLSTWAAVWQAVFLPYYFFKVMHYTVLSSAFLADIVLVFGALGKVVLGGTSDYIKRNKLLPIVTLIVLVSYAVFFESHNFLINLYSAISMGFFSAAIFPIMQSLAADSCDGETGTALGLTTTTQSIATVFSTLIAGSLFVIGIGKSLALDAMLPAVLALVVALFLKEPRVILGKESEDFTKSV